MVVSALSNQSFPVMFLLHTAMYLILIVLHVRAKFSLKGYNPSSGASWARSRKKLVEPGQYRTRRDNKQEGQLSQRGRAMPRVVE